MREEHFKVKNIQYASLNVIVHSCTPNFGFIRLLTVWNLLNGHSTQSAKTFLRVLIVPITFLGQLIVDVLQWPHYG